VSIADRPVDPFDLPDWLGEATVVWRAGSGVAERHLVCGSLASGQADGLPAEELACDLLAVDEAYPAPVADGDLRHAAHLAWRHGQVHLLRVEGRLTLAVPGTGFTAERILEALTRLAFAVGAEPSRYAVLLRLGG